MKIRSTARISIHKYRWFGPGNAEDHGRGLYAFDISSTFQGDKRFNPPLFPDTLNALRGLYEARTVGTLLLANIGPVKCRIVDWAETHTGGIPDGAGADISFLEEGDNIFAALTSSAQGTAKLKAARDAWEVVADNHKTAVATTVSDRVFHVQSERESDLFSEILKAADSVIAFRDRGLLYGEMVSAHLAALQNLIDEADKTVQFFENASNWEALFALKELASSVIEIVNNPTRRGPLRNFTVDQTMTVSQLSTRIYGSTERAGDLLGLNYFPEPLRIPAGTSVKYLAA